MTEAQPLVSIDVVPLRFNKRLEKLEFATGVRLFEPYKGEQALPGVLLNTGESIREAAHRALQVKVGLPPGELIQIGSFDSTNRDPRGATISIAFLSAQPEAIQSARAFWHSEMLELPFDHQAIVETALARVHQVLWNDVALTRALLGESFTTADAVALNSPTPNVSNVSRWLKTWGEVKKSATKTVNTGAGRPASTWEWVEK